MHFAANYAGHVAPAALFAAEQIEKGQDSGGLEVCPRCISPWRRWRRIRNKQGESDLYPRPTGMASLRVIILAPLKFSQLKKSAYMNNIYHFRIPFRMNFKSPIKIYSLCCIALYWPRIDFSVTLEFSNIGHIHTYFQPLLIPCNRSTVCCGGCSFRPRPSMWHSPC